MTAVAFVEAAVQSPRTTTRITGVITIPPPT
jgi:hypothetical protein